MSSQIAVWQNQMAEIKRIYGRDLSAVQFDLFVGMGKSLQLNPFLREIWAVKFSGQVSIFVGRDGYRKNGLRQKTYDGHIVDSIYSNDSFKVKAGEIIHEYADNPRGDLVGAYCVVYKKDQRIPTFVSVRLEEYQLNTLIWNKKPETMIKKVAESQCFKMAYPDVFNGTYDESENWTETGSPALDPDKEVRQPDHDTYRDRKSSQFDHTRRGNQNNANQEPTDQRDKNADENPKVVLAKKRTRVIQYLESNSKIFDASTLQEFRIETAKCVILADFDQMVERINDKISEIKAEQVEPPPETKEEEKPAQRQPRSSKPKATTPKPKATTPKSDDTETPFENLPDTSDIDPGIDKRKNSIKACYSLLVPNIITKAEFCSFEIEQFPKGYGKSEDMDALNEFHSILKEIYKNNQQGEQ